MSSRRPASSKPETDGSGGVPPERLVPGEHLPVRANRSGVRQGRGARFDRHARFPPQPALARSPEGFCSVSISSGPSLRSIRSEPSPPSLTRIGTHCRNLAASLRPAYLAGSSRASMQVRIANRRAAARGSSFGARFNVVLIYCKFRLRFGL